MLSKTYLICCLMLATTSFQNSIAQEISGDPFFASYPESGSWFAMDDSNTGFFMSVQNGILAGAYFGFDGDGENVWLLFNGALEPVFDINTLTLQTGWRLDTNLMQGANGGCILDCINNNPEPRESTVVESIVLEFAGRSTATFTVGDGEPVDVFPLYFGVPAFIEPLVDAIQIDDGSIIGKDVLIVSPDLEGTWAVALGNYDVDADGNVIESSLAETAGIIEIGPREIMPPGPMGVPPSIITTRTTEAAILRDTTGLFGNNPRLSCAFNAEFSFVEGFEPDGFCLITPLNPDQFPINSEIATQGRVQVQSDSRFVMQIRVQDFVQPASTGTAIRLEFFRVGYN